MLNPDERALLQAFVDRSPPETPYLRRAQILLLCDEEISPETAAGRVGASITQTRSLLRAFKRQRLALFPENALREPPLFSPDAPIAEAGRLIMARQLEQIRAYGEEVRNSADITAVHETRKAVREMGTALKRFALFFAPGLLENYRRPLKKLMRRLGHSRDAAVFLEKLTQFISEGSATLGAFTVIEQEALHGLVDYWQERKATFDEAVQQYLAQPEWPLFFDELARFSRAVGEGVPEPDDPLTPIKVRYVAPGLIYQQLAAVRAYEDCLENASLEVMHRLRLQAKELRYTLQFFEPVMGPTAVEAIAVVKRIQELLGELNDARIAQELLSQAAEEERLAAAVVLYQAAKEEEISRLMVDFRDVWNEFNQLAWRQKMATAVAVL